MNDVERFWYNKGREREAFGPAIEKPVFWMGFAVGVPIGFAMWNVLIHWIA